MSKRIVIVGGVAAGASAAAKARRTNEDVEIVLVEAGPYISFANCGLPYYVGGEIARRESLFVVNPKMFANRFNVILHTETRATSVDRDEQTVTLAKPNGDTETLSYDRLILATGTTAIKPPIDGLDRDNIFTVRTVPDVDAITGFLSEHKAVSAHDQESPIRALVIGAGYIGLETAEQLARRGLKVTVVELADQVMLATDPEIALPLQKQLEDNGIEVRLADAVARIEDRHGQSVAVTGSGAEIPFELGILSTGVRPNVELARQAGVVLGETGAIAVDDLQRTSDPHIYAAGDNSETMHLVLGRAVNIPLAGPANKAGRAAGANAAMDLLDLPDADPRRLKLRGVLGTAGVRVFDLTAGATGLTERAAVEEGIEYGVIYLGGASHAGYYPGAKMLLIKLLYDPESGAILGAQAVGGEGVDKRIDVLATAITAEMTLEDLEQLDLCYAPPFGSAKDLEIMVGFAGANARRGVMPVSTPREMLDALAGQAPPVILDVRTQKEWDAGHLDGAIHIPVDELRGRLDEVPEGRPVHVHCAGGYRSYVAQRMLMNAGRQEVYNVTGGYTMIERIGRIDIDRPRQPSA
jgi:NADPH-dependent 2,4-dienoyl-CoA reductase/sulfur reductase-like enzyme/rhodanese-related sulfurtransferase